LPSRFRVATQSAARGSSIRKACCAGRNWEIDTVSALAHGRTVFRPGACHDVVARISSGAGLPDAPPDFFGIAVRLVDAHGPDGHQNLLINSSSRLPVLHHLFLPPAALVRADLRRPPASPVRLSAVPHRPIAAGRARSRPPARRHAGSREQRVAFGIAVAGPLALEPRRHAAPTPPDSASSRRSRLCPMEHRRRAHPRHMAQPARGLPSRAAAAATRRGRSRHSGLKAEHQHIGGAE
jgi:hypothetical protein